jgi:hypothetical protein
MKILKTLAFLWLVALIFPTRAHAYLDLGTGSYIAQIAIATFMGAGFFLKNYWSSIKSKFSSKRDEGSSDE